MSIPPWSIIRLMSREDSQFKLRMPSELREAIESSAKDAKRSLNAEIVARLETTVLKQSIGTELLQANKAKELSAAFRKSIPIEMKTRIIDSVNDSVMHGLASAQVDFSDMGLDSLPHGQAEEIMDSFGEMLSAAGYRYEWDGPDTLWIDFDDL
nr:MAG TPA: Mnt [Caudoviricetes sp.]